MTEKKPLLRLQEEQTFIPCYSP